LLLELPDSIKYDLLLFRFQEAIENSVIFKDDLGDIDVSLTNSILKRLETRKFLPKQFIAKIGEMGSDTFIILDGEVTMYGIDNECLGVLKSGSHISNILRDNMHPSLCKKRVAHLVVKQFAVVGVLAAEDAKTLGMAYPSWHQKFILTNEFLFKSSLKNI